MENQNKPKQSIFVTLTVIFSIVNLIIILLLIYKCQNSNSNIMEFSIKTKDSEIYEFKLPIENQDDIKIFLKEFKDIKENMK